MAMVDLGHPLKLFSSGRPVVDRQCEAVSYSFLHALHSLHLRCEALATRDGR